MPKPYSNQLVPSMIYQKTSIEDQFDILCDQSMVVKAEKRTMGGQSKVMRTVGFSLSDEHRGDAMLDLAK